MFGKKKSSSKNNVEPVVFDDSVEVDTSEKTLFDDGEDEKAACFTTCSDPACDECKNCKDVVACFAEYKAEGVVDTESETKVLDKEVVLEPVEDGGVAFCLLDPSSEKPVRKAGDAGFDLKIKSLECVDKHNGAVRPVRTNAKGAWDVFAGVVYHAKTGVCCKIPAGEFGLIKPRSGMSYKFGMNVLAGVIDETYTGELVVIFTTAINTEIEKGNRVAQMVVIPYNNKQHGVVESLEDTERGDKGFGSSGR